MPYRSLVVIALVLAFTTPVAAQTQPDAPAAGAGSDPAAKDAQKQGAGRLVSPDPLELLLDATGYRSAQERLGREFGLEIKAGYTLIFQVASDVIDEQEHLLSGSFDLAGHWHLIETDAAGDGAVGFLVEGGQIITAGESEDLSANIGSGFGVNDDLDNEDIAVTELWYSHRFADDALALTAGKIDQTVFFDANRVANDETTQFLATPLVNNPSVAFPDNGFGANLKAVPSDWLYLSAGWGNSVADARETTVNNLDIDDSFSAIELGLTPTFGDDRQGHYRILVWYSQVGDAAGSGIAISIDQHIGQGLVPFFRYGHGEPAVSDFQHFVSAGIGLEGPFTRTDDLLAVGLAWGEFHDPALNDETLIEAFYRLQLTDTMTLTPHLQLIHNPAAGTADDVAVIGVRSQWVF